MSKTKLVCRGCGSMCGQQTAHGRIADRERRRIRRALNPLLMRLKSVSESALDETDGIFWRNSVDQLDAATRAKKGKCT